MEVRIAKTAGFCFGVKRAVATVYEEIKNGKDKQEIIYTYGPIIHNEQVVSDLENKGVRVIHGKEDLKSITEGTVIIRSHGVDRETYDMIRSQGLKLVDATCPFVKKIHRTVEEKSREGYDIIIIGNEDHPEVQGIKGWSESDTYIMNTEEEAEKFSIFPGKKLCVVAQTTFNYKKFKDIVDIFSKKSYDIDVMNTICNATEERQTEAGTIARQSDAMLVIGGKHSSNTQKLYEICRKECENTYFIQTLDDLDLKQLQSFRSVGITAGASTPNNIIKEVQSYVRNE